MIYLKKRLLLLGLILLFLFSSTAMAGSILPSWDAASTEAISFGAALGVKPTHVITHPDGSTQYTYSPVTADDYDVFGVYLGENGYVLESYEVQEGAIVARIVKDSLSLIVSYHAQDAWLSVRYPAGVKIEQASQSDPLQGYTRLEWGQQLSIPGLGKITFTKAHLNEPLTSYILSYNSVTRALTYRNGRFSLYAETEGRAPFQAWVEGTFLNTSVDEQPIANLFDAELVYITDENTYSYSLNAPYKNLGQLDDDGRLYLYTIDTSWGDYQMSLNMRKKAAVQSLDQISFAAGFADVPAAIYAGQDGTVAILITFESSEETYALKIR